MSEINQIIFFFFFQFNKNAVTDREHRQGKRVFFRDGRRRGAHMQGRCGRNEVSRHWRSEPLQMCEPQPILEKPSFPAGGATFSGGKEGGKRLPVDGKK